MRHDSADIGDRLDLDAEEDQPAAVRLRDLEGNAGQSKETGRIGSGSESVDKGGLDEIEIRLAPILAFRPRTAPMRCLPLHSRPVVGGVVVTDARRASIVVSRSVVHVTS